MMVRFTDYHYMEDRSTTINIQNMVILTDGASKHDWSAKISKFEHNWLNFSEKLQYEHNFHQDTIFLCDNNEISLHRYFSSDSLKAAQSSDNFLIHKYTHSPTTSINSTKTSKSSINDSHRGARSGFRPQNHFCVTFMESTVTEPRLWTEFLSVAQFCKCKGISDVRIVSLCMTSETLSQEDCRASGWI